ncbi:Zinc finger and SCAN domain-containing protein 22 [Eumeta japonica]|uniref:Zinc finger and SCAN domain-containing protein 22 n=1 Tax=Eumeta variegata TaxID=151549 RepID=A0A4C1VXX4_EUMVA|nr:Zinc finger and SCAN domain-containing protein 22 [Eumeta japonica]
MYEQIRKELALSFLLAFPEGKLPSERAVMRRLPEVPKEYSVEEDPQSGTKYYVCDRCGSRIKTITSMRMHILNIHLKVPTFQCQLCPERFKYANTRNRHMSIVHGGERIRYPCQACDQVFLSRTALVQHIRNFHLQERPYKCDSCEMSFFSMVYLRRHMIKHTGERVFECKVCKKTFPRKNTLVLHERIHSNDRRFVCSFAKETIVIEVAVSEKNSLERLLRNVILTALNLTRKYCAAARRTAGHPIVPALAVWLSVY